MFSKLRIWTNYQFLYSDIHAHMFVCRMKNLAFKTGRGRRLHKPTFIYKMNHLVFKMEEENYLLHCFGPLRWIAKCHEYAVCQNSTHNDHAE